MIDQIVTLRKTLSTEAKTRLTISVSKGNNLIYHPLNYMLFLLLLLLLLSISARRHRIDDYVSCMRGEGKNHLIYYTECFHFLVCSDVFFLFILMFQLIHNHQIEALNERVTVKKMLPAEPCVRAECYLRLIQ